MQNFNLTEMQAYLAMFVFLDKLYTRTKSDDLAGFLGSMQINKFDNRPMDSAYWTDWLKSIQQVIQNSDEGKN